MFRALLYGSYKKPRELLWLTGALLFLLLLAEAYTGYVLPWGQMSYWATKVIISIFTVIPIIGKKLAIWIQGDYQVSGVTLHRFFSFHVIAFPLILLGMVFIHIIALHSVGSNNPDGVEISDHLNSRGIPFDGVPFHPYFTVKDLFGVIVFLFFFLAVVFYAPTGGGYFLEKDNFIPANPLITPSHIQPVWYMSPFYAILRAIPSKTWGAIAMLASIAVIFIVPWLDKSRVKSMRYKGKYSHFALFLLVVSFFLLGVLGTLPAQGATVTFARLFSFTYFAVFLCMPWYTKLEKTKQPPTRLT